MLFRSKLTEHVSTMAARVGKAEAAVENASDILADVLSHGERLDTVEARLARVESALSVACVDVADCDGRINALLTFQRKAEASIENLGDSLADLQRGMRESGADADEIRNLLTLAFVRIGTLESWRRGQTKPEASPPPQPMPPEPPTVTSAADAGKEGA